MLVDLLSSGSSSSGPEQWQNYALVELEDVVCNTFYTRKYAIQCQQYWMPEYKTDSLKYAVKTNI